MDDSPGITFGMIVLNSEPFLRYNLRALYPFAHQIVVVEGAAPAAAGIATPDGHSTDGTLGTLRDFKRHEDPEHKLMIITAEDEGHANGFWPGEKHEQSQAYARRATGDYLWQVDVDEFYRPDDVRAVLGMLRDDTNISGMSFKTITLWGDFDYVVDGWYLRGGADTFHRLFKWGVEYQYLTHRPPTVHNDRGQDVRSLRWVSAQTLARQGVYLYHYALLFPRQVTDKCEYYGQAEWAGRSRAQRWAQESFLELRRPFRPHNVYSHPSWLDRFRGSHPPQITCMRDDIIAGRVDAVVRRSEDVERLLGSPWYSLGRGWLKLLSHLYLVAYPGWRMIRPHLRAIRNA